MQYCSFSTKEVQPLCPFFKTPYKYGSNFLIIVPPALSESYALSSLRPLRLEPLSHWMVGVGGDKDSFFGPTLAIFSMPQAWPLQTWTNTRAP